LKIPKMIIFDYGHTLVYEDRWDGLKANKELYKYIISNKNNVTAEQITEVADKFYADTNIGRKYDIEVHAHQFQNFLHEYLQIETSLSPVEYEKILWDNAAPAYPMTNIKEVLKYLHENNIRTGVISNISFSGEALKNRINEVLPENHFEFIIASSEYVFRKPNRFIFEIALRKANLSASEVWYCGDNLDCDVAGANSVGIFPVWYESEIECWYRERGKQNEPECEHLHITDWQELIKFLENLK